MEVAMRDLASVMADVHMRYNMPGGMEGIPGG
jgi:hypothetical protein